MGKENKEKEKENLEVDIFGGEKKNVTGKGGKYFKREYTFCRGGDELGRTIFGEGQYFFCGGKKHGKGKYLFAEEKERRKIFGKGKYMFCVRTEKPRGKRRKI